MQTNLDADPLIQPERISLLIELSLFKNASQRFWVQVLTWMSGNRDAPALAWMFVLPVISFGSDVIPAVILQQLDDFFDLEPSSHNLSTG